MNLRQLAASDAASIMSDTATGFGWSVRVAQPGGDPVEVTGFSGDIAQVIDPETGQAVSGRLAHVALPISSLTAVGLGIPKGVISTDEKPWIILFDDLEGTQVRFIVAESNPDRTIGIVVLVLEALK